MCRHTAPTKSPAALRHAAASLVSAAALIAMPAPAAAFDLTGLWVNKGTACTDAFVKRGKSIRFKPQLVADGFIADKSRVRGPYSTCRIRSSRVEGDVHHVVLDCSNHVVTSQTVVSFKVADDNTIARIFPGFPELDVTFTRCTL